MRADWSLRVRTGIGHGQKTRAFVSDLEVLVGKLLAVDRLATSSLYQSQFSGPQLIPFSFLFGSFVVFRHERVDSHCHE